MYRTEAFVLFWTACCHLLTQFSSGHLVFIQLAGEDGFASSQFGFVLTVVHGLCFLMYPLMGVIAEVYCTRYKMILSGTYIQLVGAIIMTATSCLVFFRPEVDFRITYTMVVVPYALIQLGLAMVESNAIQFGSDQLINCSSGELSSFIYWYFWAIFFGHGLISCLLLILPAFLGFGESSGIILMFISILQVISNVVVIVIAHTQLFKLEIQPIGSNPVKLIKEVLVYVYRHPSPVNRSAFTYNNDQVSRIDFCKTRFGGPFTTEQVEDVKTFFRILLVFVGLVGFRFTDETGGIAQQIAILSSYRNATSISYEPWFDFLTADIFGISALTILISIPIYQLIVKKVSSKWQPSMLKRMFMGLVCVLLAEITVVAIHVVNTVSAQELECRLCSLQLCSTEYAGNNTVYSALIAYGYNFLLIPQILNGLGFVFVFLTIMEFVLAQGPRRMQGLLIGLWYSLLSVNLSIIAIETFNSVSCRPYVLGIKLFVMIVGVFLYAMISVKYKRRTRNELADININTRIEDYVERQLQVESYLKMKERELELNQNQAFIVISSDDVI